MTGDLPESVSRPWREKFDVIVAGDVLEHLPSPEALLARLTPLLAPGGTLLASLPNVANVTVRAALLFGSFPYADRGILDRTHLRFYTRETARALLETSGLRVTSEAATAMPVELALPALGRPPIAGAVRAGASALARALPALFGYQFVFEAAAA